MSLLDLKLRQGGRYAHYYFGLDRASSTIFLDFYNASSRDFCPPDNRMGYLHRKTYHHRHFAIRRPIWTESSRCLSPVFPGCFLGNERVVETFDDSAGRNILPKRCNIYRSGRHPVSSQWQKSQWCMLVARRGSFDRYKYSPRLGPEPGSAYTENKSSLGWRTTWPANQYETSPKEWADFYKTGQPDAHGSCPLAASKVFSVQCGRFLRLSGRRGYTQHSYNLAYASGRKYLRFARQEKEKDKRQTSQERQKAACPRKDGQKNSQLQACQNLRTRQEQKTAGIYQKSCMVQGLAEAGASGNQSRPCRQRKRRLFLHHGLEFGSCRSDKWFCGPMEYRGYLQKHQTVYRWPGTSDLETQRPRASGSFESVDLFCHLAVVSSAKIEAEIFFCSAVVSGQVCSELCRCVELPSPCALAG